MADGGQIEYTVSADTADLLTAQKNAEKFVITIGQGMKRADAAVDDFRKNLERMGRTVDSTGRVVTAFGKADIEATRHLERLNAQAKIARYQSQGVGTSMTKTATAVNQATNSFRMMRGGAANLSYQLQDIIVQAQMGTSAFTIIAQQGPQIASIFGPMGAALGVAIALTAALGPAIVGAFTSGSSAAKDYEKTMERVNAAITLSSDGISGYSDQMKVLAQVSESLAKIKVANIIADQFSAMQATAKMINESIGEFRGLNYEMDLFGNKSDGAFKSFLSLSEAARDLQSGIDDKKIQNLASALEQADKAGINSTKSGRQLVGTVTDLIAQYKLGEITIKDLKKQLDGVNFDVEGAKETADEIANASDRMSEMLLSANHEVAILKTRLNDGNDAAEDLATNLEVARAGAAASGEEVDTMTNAILEARREARRLSEELESRERGVDVANRVSTSETVTADYQTNMTDLQAAYDAQLISHEQFLATKKELDAAYAQDFLANSSMMTQIAMTSVNALSGGVANAFSQIASGSASAEDAMRSLAQTIINSVLQSLIQTAVQYTILPALANAFGAAQAGAAATAAAGSIAATQATAASSTVASAEVAAAAAPAAAATATWSFGSAALVGAAALGSIFLLSKSLAGNRRYGGQVSSGNMYQVNESGIPEVYSYGNNDYLMASGNAMITPLDKFGGDGGINLNINNYASDSVSVSAQKTESGYDIDVISKKVQGDIAKGIQKKQGPVYQSVRNVK